MILVLALPARVYTHYLTAFIWGVLLPVLLYAIYIYGLSAIRRRKGSLTNAVGFLFFTVFALNDMLFYSGFLATDDLLSIGLFAFFDAGAQSFGPFLAGDAGNRAING